MAVKWSNFNSQALTSHFESFWSIVLCKFRFETHVSTFSYSDGDSMFAKPFPVKPKLKTTEVENEQENKKSLAKMILMRESLAGLPRASLSGLFRQSLSIQELDRMFDDDSTQSFEDLERRLKTPAKAKASSRITDKVHEESPKKDSKKEEVKVSNCTV